MIARILISAALAAALPAAASAQESPEPMSFEEADVDRSGDLDETELREWMFQSLDWDDDGNLDGSEEAVAEVVWSEELVEEHDDDRHGVLDEREFRSLWAREQYFDTLDLNEDAVVSQEEFGWRES